MHVTCHLLILFCSTKVLLHLLSNSSLLLHLLSNSSFQVPNIQSLMGFLSLYNLVVFLVGQNTTSHFFCLLFSFLLTSILLPYQKEILFPKIVKHQIWSSLTAIFSYFMFSSPITTSYHCFPSLFFVPNFKYTNFFLREVCHC